MHSDQSNQGEVAEPRGSLVLGSQGSMGGSAEGLVQNVLDQKPQLQSQVGEVFFSL